VSASASDFDKAIHSWIFFGIRGDFLLGGS